MRRSRQLLAALALVALGRALSPDAVPVYDGVGSPDEPYRYVVRPEGAPKTAEATSAEQTTPVVAGLSTNGLTVATAEQGPQVLLYLPPKALRSTAVSVRIQVAPVAPTDAPPGRRIDGNVYEVRLTAAKPVTVAEPATRLGSVTMRATTGQQPGPVMQHRAAATDPWTALKTSRAGQDIYTAAFAGPGQYALAFSASASTGRSALLPWLLVAGVVVLLSSVVVLRLRTPPG